ncbi:MAG: 5'/3'-nucleotidase SurE, partial [Bullifex sp.]
MTILLTNDDGYEAEGIKVLESVFSEKHEVWVVSPSGNRSAQSHAMNLREPIKMTKYGENRWHCSGTPTDCILYSIRGGLFPRKPDLIISGINHGANCSSDILYSGTCGAAMEGVMQGIASIALSVEKGDDGSFGFEPAARFALDNLDKLISLTAIDSIVNVNFPTPHSGRVFSAGVGLIDYPDKPIPCTDNDGVITYRLGGGDVEKNIYH